jgi:ATP-dependent DNA ligase I
MTMMKLARMCEALENASTTTRKIEIIRESIRAFDRPQLVLKILSNDLESNNISRVRAITWLAKMFGIFEDEIQAQEDTWGDVAEGMHQFLESDEKNEKIGILSFYNLINLNCSSINGDSYEIISSILPRLSNLEVKWFIRYWLRKPRHGVSHSTIIKMLNKEYPDKEVNRYANYTTMGALYDWCEYDVRIDMSNMIGRFIQPMLAKTYKNELPDEYVIDMKYDGNRYQIHHNFLSEWDATATIIFNRTGKIVSDQFPDIVEMFKGHKGEWIVDAEIYPIESDGIPAPHKRLATRVHSKDKVKAVQECPIELILFDMMYNDGTLIANEPYKTRLEALEDELTGFNMAHQLPQDITSAYNQAINAGFEGIMIKDLNAAYDAGKRSSSLLKHKPPLVELDVAITSAKYGEGKRNMVFGTYGVSVKDGDDYTHIGYVGTGLSDDDLRRLTSQLKPTVESYEDETKEWVFHPRVVLELRADLVSQDKDGNYSLRFPRVHRIRDDKYPANINTMNDLIALA